MWLSEAATTIIMMRTAVMLPTTTPHVHRLGTCCRDREYPQQYTWVKVIIDMTAAWTAKKMSLTWTRGPLEELG
jgi:hypothetical protein